VSVREQPDQTKMPPIVTMRTEHSANVQLTPQKLPGSTEATTATEREPAIKEHVLELQGDDIQKYIKSSKFGSIYLIHF